MAVKSVKLGKPFTHVFSEDKRPPKIKPSEGNPHPDNSEHDDWKPTTWHLRALPSKVMGYLKDRTTKILVDPNDPDGDVGTEINQNQFYYDVVALGLSEAPDNFDTGVEFKTAKRNIRGTSYPVVVDEFMDTIPPKVIAELARCIEAGNSLSEEEGNGSGSQSSEPTSSPSEIAPVALIETGSNTGVTTTSQDQ